MNKTWIYAIALIILSAAGCSRFSPATYNFALTETSQLTETKKSTIKIDNCNSFFPKTKIYKYPTPSKTVTAGNLIPNGDEPFVSLRKQIHAKYRPHTFGTRLFKRLMVPAGTRQQFTFEIIKTLANGTVEAPIIDVNKIYPFADVTYVYTLGAEIKIQSVQDLPCQ